MDNSAKSISENTDFFSSLVKDKFTGVTKGYDLSYCACCVKTSEVYLVTQFTTIPPTLNDFIFNFLLIWLGAKCFTFKFSDY